MFGPLALIFPLFCARLSAQEPPYRIEHVSIEQGVPHNYIQCMLQDRNGFMWFGTLLGLVRFDGYTYKTYRHDPRDPFSLSNDDIAALYEDADQNLWIGTYQGGLNKFDPRQGKFTRYLHNPADSAGISHGAVWSICADRYGMLWIGTEGGGLCKFDEKTQRFMCYQNDPQDAHSLSSNYVAEIYEDQAGTLWIGTLGGGLCRLDREHNRFIAYHHDPANSKSLSSDRVRAIYEDQNGSLWIGTGGGGLDKFMRPGEEFEHCRHDPANPQSLSGNNVTHIFEDRKGVLWIGTARGLNRFDRERGEFTRFFDSSAAGQGANFITAICQDNAGTLWIGTNHDGLKKIHEGGCKFGRYAQHQGEAAGLSHRVVFGIHEDRRERLWIGTVAGLDLLDEERNQFTHYLPEFDPDNPMSGRTVLAIAEGHSGELWLGTTRGLQRFEPGTGRFQAYITNSSDTTSLSHNTVTALCWDRFGALWVGTRWGLNRFDPKTKNFTRYYHRYSDPHSLSENYVAALYEDRSGTLWVGTYGGLNYLDRERRLFVRFKHDISDANSLSHDYCFTIHEDRRGALWIGTGGGLNLHDRKTGGFTHYTEKHGLPNSVICGILEDDHGRLWLSTQKGLSRFDPETGSFANFDLSDGLMSNLFTLGSYHKRRNGTLVFGVFYGVNYFHPDSLKSNPSVPPVAITAFTKIDQGKEVSRDAVALQELELSYRENFFTLEFAALNFIQPEKNQYAYRLEGLEPDWIQAGHRRHASYTDINPGNYIFRVKGSNNDGVWNEQGAAIKIRITPPFWRTSWFAILCAGATILLIAVVHRLAVRAKINQLLAIERARRLESEQVRKRAANDFHDELGHRLARIALFGEIVKRKWKGQAEEAAAYLDKIIDDSQRLSHDTRDFIWALDPNKDSLFEAMHYLREFAEELFDRTAISFHVEGLTEELDLIKLSAEAKRHLTLLFKEGLTNILKHAECRSAALKVEVVGGQVQITLADDGKGCHHHMNGNGHGLKSMRERAEKLRGIVRIISQPGAGMQIQLITNV